MKEKKRRWEIEIICLIWSCLVSQQVRAVCMRAPGPRLDRGAGVRLPCFTSPPAAEALTPPSRPCCTKQPLIISE